MSPSLKSDVADAADLEELFDLDLTVAPVAERRLPEMSTVTTCSPSGGVCDSCTGTAKWTCGGTTGRPCAC